MDSIQNARPSEAEPQTASELIHEALDRFRSNRPEEAEQVLRAALQREPEHAPALNLLGVVLSGRRGCELEAAEAMRQAVRIDPGKVGYRNNLGSILWQLDDFQGALEQFNDALELDPSNAETWYNCGNANRSLQRFSEAEQAFRRATELAPERGDIRNNLGSLLIESGRIEEAVGVLLEAIDVDPRCADCLGSLGLAYSHVGRLDESEAAYRQAIKIAPHRTDLRGNLSGILYRQRRFDDAIAECRRVIIADPKSPQAYNNLGVSLHNLGRLEEAVATLQMATELDPGSAGCHLNLGTALDDAEDHESAARAFQKAVSIEPNWPLSLINLGNTWLKLDRIAEAREVMEKAVRLGPHPYLSSAYCSLALILSRFGLWQEALECFDQAIQETPDNVHARFGRGMLLLKLGRFHEGWREYEWRFDAQKYYYLKEPDWRLPEWHGQPFPGKTLLVYHEQGMGDLIHFIRYLPKVKALGGRMLLMCGPPLFRLAESVPGIDYVFSRRDPGAHPDVRFDFHIPLLSLPRIFGTELESIPSDVPYLDVPPELENHWAARVEDDAFRIGIAWCGNPDQGDNHRRSCRAADFAPLFAVPGTRFYSLQKGDAAAELSSGGPMFDRVVDLTAEFHDMADTAALMKNLDLIITIDTSIAHLAGALGRPVWTVLWFNHCWRYLLERTDSPWYPTMRLFRQRTDRDWQPVFDDVSRELRNLIQRQGGDN